MEQDEGAAVDMSEVNTEQGCEAPAPAVLAGEVAGVEEGVQKHVSETDNPASEGAKKQDPEEPPPESGVESEDREAFEDTIATRFEFRAAAAAADATPPPTSLRSRSRSRNQSGPSPTKFTASGDAEPVRSDIEAPALGASSSSSAPATGTHVPAMDGGHQVAALGGDKKMKRVCSAPGAKVAIAHASPRDSYRRIPWRSRKQYSPKRFVAAAGAPPPASSPGSALPSALASGLRLGTGASPDATASSAVIDASASSSCSNRPPSRGRKQQRPAHFIPEEAEATASAKARRSDIVLDRFLSSHVGGSSASDSEWVKNVTAADDAIRGDRPRGVEGFRIRDASRHAARALSRLGCASPPSSASPPGEPGGRGRSYGVLAILGAGLALTVAACVLFYVVGQRSEPGPPVEKPDE